MSCDFNCLQSLYQEKAESLEKELQMSHIEKEKLVQQLEQLRNQGKVRERTELVGGFPVKLPYQTVKEGRGEREGLGWAPMG